MSMRRSKKSETLEVRLEHEVKEALMRKAQLEGRSTSDVVREFIQLYLADKPKEARSMIFALWKPATAIGAASVAALVALVTPATLHARPDLGAIFKSLDRDGNDALTVGEFQQLTSNPEVQKAHEARMAAGHQGKAGAHGIAGHAAHAAASPEMIGAHFAKLDSNSDGSLTLEEIEQHHDRMEQGHKPR